MEPRIGYAKEDAIISERPPLRHDCLAPGGAAPQEKTGPSSDEPGITAPPPFPRPPCAAQPVTCRGCFNRCVLSPGEPGTCTVKRNIAGRITGVSLRVKAVVGGP